MPALLDIRGEAFSRWLPELLGRAGLCGDGDLELESEARDWCAAEEAEEFLLLGDIPSAAEPRAAYAEAAPEPSAP